ncbi:MAG: hypothetical protein AAGA60_09430 [Cyanobacteria bacterium P01_E01_bin.42]
MQITTRELSPDLRQFAKSRRLLWQFAQTTKELACNPEFQDIPKEALGQKVVALVSNFAENLIYDETEFEPGQPVKQGDRVGIVGLPASSKKREITVFFDGLHGKPCAESCDRDSLIKILPPIPSDSECQ